MINNHKEHIIFPIEVKRREFLSRLTLAVNGLKNGYPVLIGDRDGCHREMQYLPTCFYLAKSLSVDLLPVFKKIKKKEGKIFVLFEEGGYVLRENNKHEEIKSFYPEEMLPYVDYLLTYGKSYQNLLIENFSSLNTTNTYISGNTRFDLHKPKFSSLFTDEIEKIKKEHKKYVLINTNFGLANNILGEEFIANEFKNSKDFTPKLVEYYLELQKNQKKDLIDYTKMISTIADYFKNINFVVRPHPVENDDFYIKIFSNLKNVVVTSKGPAAPWIIGSDLIIHKDCTTAIESYFANKPVISYQSSDDPNILWLPPIVSDIARSENEVIEKLKKYLISNSEFQISNENEEKLINEVENVNQETAHLFMKLIKGISDNQIKSHSEDLVLKKLSPFLKRSWSFLRWNKAKYYKKNVYARSFEGLSRKEVKKNIEKILEIENIQLEYKIKQKGVNTFLIEKV